MRSEAQKYADARYKKKIKRITLDFSLAEEETWNFIQSQENKQGFIKQLIRAEMQKEQA